MENLVNEIMADLERYVREGAEARTKLVSRLTSPGTLCHRLSWGEGMSADYLSKLAAHTLDMVAKGNTLKEAIDYHVQYHTRDLVQKTWRFCSTSLWDLAENETKRSVTSEYVSELTTWTMLLDVDEEKSTAPS